MASAGKKTKKKKKTTISINGPVFSSSVAPLLESWADQSEIELIESIRNTDTGINLPKAPRSTRECEFDSSHVPTSGPFQAHLTNIPFDITEDEIIDCFSKFTIMNCTLPKDGRSGSNRLKGYGYIEFDTREELIEALCIGEMNVKGRRMKIDLPGKDQDRFRNDRGGRDMHRQGSNRADGDPDDPDRTFSDWRNAPRAVTSDRDSDRSGYRKDDRSFKRSGFGERDSERPKEIDDDSCWRDGNREAPARENTDGGSGGGSGGGNRWRERDRSGGFEKRGERFEKRGEDFERRGGDRNGFERGRDRDRDRDRNRDGEKEREGSLDWRADKGGETNSRAFDRRDRDSGFGVRRDRDREGGAFERRGREGGFREGGFSRRDRDEGFERRGDRDREGFDRKGEPDRSERGWREEPRVIPTPLPNTREVSSRDSRDSGPRNAGPRDSGPRDSGPRDSGARDSGPKDSGPRDAGSRDASASPVREKKDEPPATRKPLNLKPRTAPLTSRDPETTQSSVFGSAKPVDTAAKERELEEKWNKEKHVPSGGGRISKDKDQRKEKDSDSRPSKENEPPKEVNKILEPAPPPKENAWTKRRTQQTSNNGHLDAEEAKMVEKIDSESKERHEEIVATNESKPKPAQVEAAPKETFKPKPKENCSNDVKTSSHQPINDSKKSDDRPVNSRTPPKVNDKPVKPQSQEQPADEDSEWSTKVSRKKYQGKSGNQKVQE